MLIIPYTHFNFNFNSGQDVTSLELDSAYYNTDNYKLTNNATYYITIDPNFMKFTNNPINSPHQNQNILFLSDWGQPIHEPQDKYWSFIAVS